MQPFCELSWLLRRERSERTHSVTCRLSIHMIFIENYNLEIRAEKVRWNMLIVLTTIFLNRSTLFPCSEAFLNNTLQRD